MDINFGGHGYVGMSKHFLDCVYVDTPFPHQRAVSVPKFVRCQIRHSEFRTCRFHEQPETSCIGTRAQRFGSPDDINIVAHKSFKILTEISAERNKPVGTCGFRLVNQNLTFYLRNRPLNVDNFVVKVYVAPLQTQKFGTPYARVEQNDNVNSALFFGVLLDFFRLFSCESSFLELFGDIRKFYVSEYLSAECPPCVLSRSAE